MRSAARESFLCLMITHQWRPPSLPTTHLDRGSRTWVSGASCRPGGTPPSLHPSLGRHPSSVSESIHTACMSRAGRPHHAGYILGFGWGNRSSTCQLELPPSGTAYLDDAEELCLEPLRGGKASMPIIDARKVCNLSRGATTCCSLLGKPPVLVLLPAGALYVRFGGPASARAH